MTGSFALLLVLFAAVILLVAWPSLVSATRVSGAAITQPLAGPMTVIAVAGTMTISAIAVWLFHRCLLLQARSADAQLANDRLCRALEAIPDGFALYDQDDKLVAFNSAYKRLYGSSAPAIELGARFEDIVRYGIAHGQYDLTDTTGEDWIARRMAQHKTPSGAIEHVTADGRHLRVVEWRSSDGSTVGLRSDVTDAKLRERALKEQTTLLATTFEHIDEGLTVIDKDGALVAHNQKLRQILGLPGTVSFTGLYLAETIDFFTQAVDADDEMCAIDPSTVLKQSLLNPDRPIEWHQRDGRIIELRSTPLPSGGAVTSYRDVTETRRIENVVRLSEAQKSAILASSLDAIIVCDAFGNITDFNPAAESMFGYGASEALGQRLVDLIIPEDLRAAHEAGMKRFRDTGERRVLGRRIELPARHRTGRIFPVELSIADIRIGKRTYFAANLRDISDRKEAEAKLLQARDEAQAADRAKSEFLATISHELRTPMHAIVGLCQLLLETELDTTQRQFMGNISQSAGQLVTLVNDVLEYTRAEAGSIQIEESPFDFRVMLENVCETARVLIGAKPVELVSVTDESSPRYIVSDATRMHQVLLNLLGNSAKFTLRGNIRLHVETLARGPHRATLRISVTDTGPGFSEDVRRRLFTPFEQGKKDTARLFGGTGLGLAISKRIVHLLGGVIDCESREGGGSRFWFEVPVRIAYEADLVPLVAHDEDEPGQDQPLRILVAEDTPTSQMVIRAMLEKLGHNVQVVDDGVHAVDAVKQRDFDAIILDMQMPIMDGLTAAGVIKSLPSPKCDIPVIALTAQAFAEDREKSIAAGFAAHLAKPASLSRVRSVLRQVTINASLSEHKAPGEPSHVCSLGTLDMDVLSEMRAHMGEAVFRQLVLTFVRDTKELMETIQASAERSDTLSLRKSLHKLSGIVGQFGLGDLSRSISELEIAPEEELSELVVLRLLRSCQSGLERIEQVVGLAA